MLKLFNTLSREVEEFKPLKDGVVSLYSCGPTVYDYAHLGNLRAYICADVLKRTLIQNGFKVKHVMNITDVGHLTSNNDSGEDKIEKSARLQEKSAWEIARFYEDAFKKDLHALNIIEPDVWARATEHIDEQIALIKKLESKGYLYQTGDGLYFDTSKFADYGKMARLNLSGQEAGARVAVNSEKKNPADFAVWKFSKAEEKRQMEWESPWGKGFPGWHVECSAMSMKYLGETLDIHTGGIDHIPVHHTNEIAQSEAATGKQFVRYWLHSDFLLVNEGRMGKSEGNAFTLQELIDRGYTPRVYRYLCLSAHYRSKLNFSWETLENAWHMGVKFREKFLNLGQQQGQVNQAYMAEFIAAMNDDLNTPRAMAIGFELLKDKDLSDFDKRATLLEMDKYLGLSFAEFFSGQETEIPGAVRELAEQRQKAREEKDWERSDEIRKIIEKMGFEVEDGATGPRLKAKRT